MMQKPLKVEYLHVIVEQLGPAKLIESSNDYQELEKLAQVMDCKIYELRLLSSEDDSK